ncbi:MAG: phage tail assembly protein [Rhodoferax sp.]
MNAKSGAAAGAADESNKTATADANARVVQLENPIKRGDTTITSVTVRKPRAGELRGLSLAELLQMKVDALQALLPRITTPMLHRHDIDNLEPADLVNLGGEVVNFLLTKAQMAEFQGE